MKFSALDSLLHRLVPRRLVPKSLILALVLTTGFAPAHGAVIGTRQALNAQQDAATVARVQAFFARDDARAALIRMGVDPEQAMIRVATLTPAEAERLARRIEHLPAGEVGIVETVGLVALVLLVLELMGVTNAFTNF